MNGVSEHSKGVLRPRKMYETTVADTVERSNGIIEFIEILKRRISRTKRTPARGALNIPATAAAAPHPKRMVMLL